VCHVSASKMCRRMTPRCPVCPSRAAERYQDSVRMQGAEREAAALGAATSVGLRAPALPSTRMRRPGARGMTA
jgi:hypothetical protein